MSATDIDSSSGASKRPEETADESTKAAGQDETGSAEMLSHDQLLDRVVDRQRELLPDQGVAGPYEGLSRVAEVVQEVSESYERTVHRGVVVEESRRRKVEPAPDASAEEFSDDSIPELPTAELEGWRTEPTREAAKALGRDDSGQLRDGETLTTQRFTRDHEVGDCTVCEGTGREFCPRCEGSCKQSCSPCSGIGTIRPSCPECDDGYRTVTKECHRCNGSSDCRQCQGDGYYDEEEQCLTCNATGYQEKETCWRCDGSGERPCERCETEGTIECRTCEGAERTHRYDRITWNYDFVTHASHDPNPLETANRPGSYVLVDEEETEGSFDPEAAVEGTLDEDEIWTVRSVKREYRLPVQRATYRLDGIGRLWRELRWRTDTYDLERAGEAVSFDDSPTRLRYSQLLDPRNWSFPDGGSLRLLASLVLAVVYPLALAGALGGFSDPLFVGGSIVATLGIFGYGSLRAPDLLVLAGLGGAALFNAVMLAGVSDVTMTVVEQALATAFLLVPAVGVGVLSAGVRTYRATDPPRSG